MEPPDDYIELRLKASIVVRGPRDPEGYVTSFSGQIGLNDESESPIVGSFSAYVANLENALNNEVVWFDVLDSVNGEVAAYLELLGESDSEFREWIRDEPGVLGSNLLILDRIEVKAAFRGRGLGLRAAHALIATLGPSEGLVACLPSPFRSRLKKENPRFLASKEKLRAYWSRIGFQALPGTDLLVMSTSTKHPTIEEILRSKFSSGPEKVSPPLAYEPAQLLKMKASKGQTGPVGKNSTLSDFPP